MSHSKIGLHVAANCAGCGGIDTYWQALDAAGIPFTVYSANDAGLITSATKYGRATLVYRDVESSTVNPADYNVDPETAASAYWETTLDALPDSIKALKSRCWIELLNEPGREDAQANWVGRLMYYMARIARADGYKVMGPGWSAGTPEPYHWRMPGWEMYLRLCAAYPDSVAVSLHEYSLDEYSIATGVPWLVGRFQFLLKACADMDIVAPRIWITEAGWALNAMPDEDKAKADIEYLAALYAAHPAIQAASLWTLQGGKGNGNLPQQLNALIPWLTEYTINTTFPDVEPPPEPEPEPEPPPVMSNLLLNPSFEDGWYHPKDANGYPIMELQLPNKWELKWREYPDWPNPYDPSPAARFMRPEVRTLPASQLPPVERPIFVRDGEYTLKAFKGNGSLYFTLFQTVTGLTPGAAYTLTAPCFPDLVMDYEGGKKIWADDANAGLWQLRVDAFEVTGWLQMTPGIWNSLTALFTATAAAHTVKVDYMLPFPLPQNGIFTDDWTLAMKESTPPPPPDTYLAIVVKAPQQVTAGEWQTIAAEAFKNLHDMTASHDTMLSILERSGRMDSYVKVAYPERQADVIAMIEAAGYKWQPLPLPPPVPAIAGTFNSPVGTEAERLSGQLWD
jgi:hypothetical protein